MFWEAYRSVLPIFLNCLKKMINLPLHKEMTRFNITLNEGIELFTGA